MIRIGYNLSPMWNLGVGTMFGFGKSAIVDLTGYAFPFAAVAWTPDINVRTSPFITAGAGLFYRKNPPDNNTAPGGLLGVGIRHMIGENLALRVEGDLQVYSIGSPSQTSGAGQATVGLSLFFGARKVLTTIVVAPASPRLVSLRETQQLAATARDQNGNPMEGQPIRWSSSNPSVATVSPTGLVTAVGDGSSTITAASGTASGSASVTVARTAATVAVAPATGSLSALGATQQLTAAAHDANNNPIPSATFAWSSSDPSVASVDASGLVTAVGNGTARITATSSGRSGSASVTVAQTTASVTVTPSSASLSAVGATAQLTGQALDANGRPISGKTVTWTSDAPNVATVNPSGLVSGVANGVAHITASADGQTAAATVTMIVAARGAVTLPTTVGAHLVMRNVNFTANRATLLRASRTELDKIAIAMQADPTAKWEIGGYTSSVGTRARNMTLSRQRAESVRRYLISKGVPAANLTAVGYGPASPIGNNRTAAGRRMNMRVEIKRLQ